MRYIPGMMSIWLFSLTLLFGQSDLQLGKDWFNRRTEGAVGTTAQPGPINKAITHLEKALENPTVESEAALLLVKCLHYKAKFVAQSKDEKKAIFQRGKVLSKKQIEKHPESAAIRYWYLVNLGSWAKVSGNLAVAREGVSDIMREQSEKIIELDPEYESGGGYFMLGVAHYESPYIPFFLSWPDNDDAIVYLRKAVETGEARLMQKVYLAKALYKDRQKEEAIRFLEEVVATEPSVEHLVKDRDDIQEAGELLEDYR